MDGTGHIAVIPASAVALAAPLPDDAALHAAAGHGQRGLRPEAKKIFKKTPGVSDLKPGSRFVAKDLGEFDDITLLMNTMFDIGPRRGNCLTLTGRTIAEDLESVKWRLPPGAAIGGPITLRGEGDDIDAGGGNSNVKLTGAEPTERKTKWKARATNPTSSALWKYGRRIGPVVDGAATHPGGAHEKQCYADI